MSTLKRPITTKHKENIPTPEKERWIDHDRSLQIKMTLDERAEALYSPPQPEDKDLNQIPNNLKLECDLCGHKSESSAALKVLNQWSMT